MKTHELAKNLNELSRILKSIPNIDISELRHLIKDVKRKPSQANIAVNLQTLVALSEYNKKEWIQFIKDFDLPVYILKSYSVRDIIVKLLSFLKDNKEAQKKLIEKATNKTEYSSELLKALSIIIKDV